MAKTAQELIAEILVKAKEQDNFKAETFLGKFLQLINRNPELDILIGFLDPATAELIEGLRQKQDTTQMITEAYTALLAENKELFKLIVVEAIGFVFDELDQTQDIPFLNEAQEDALQKVLVTGVSAYIDQSISGLKH